MLRPKFGTFVSIRGCQFDTKYPMLQNQVVVSRVCLSDVQIRQLRAVLWYLVWLLFFTLSVCLFLSSCWTGSFFWMGSFSFLFLPPILCMISQNMDHHHHHHHHHHRHRHHRHHHNRTRKWWHWEPDTGLGHKVSGLHCWDKKRISSIFSAFSDIFSISFLTHFLSCFDIFSVFRCIMICRLYISCLHMIVEARQRILCIFKFILERHQCNCNGNSSFTLFVQRGDKYHRMR